MTASPDQLEALRTQITTAIKHGTDVIADLKAVADRFQILMPDDRQHTKGERWLQHQRARLAAGEDAAA